MITVDVAETVLWDDEKEEFVTVPATHLVMEHSLLSISKWESKHKKPFLEEKGEFKKTPLELLDYFSDMTISPTRVDPLVYMCIAKPDLERISNYIQETRSATWFADLYENPTGRRKEQIITSELIYYWMASMMIPFECQKWHLSRLLTLIRIFGEKSKPKDKKKNRKQLYEEHKSINERNKALMNTKG